MVMLGRFTLLTVIVSLPWDVLCARSEQDALLASCGPDEGVCDAEASTHSIAMESEQFQRSPHGRPTTDNVLLQVRDARVVIVPTVVQQIAQEVNNTDLCGGNCMLHGVVASCLARVDWVKANVEPHTVESAIVVVNRDCVGQCFCTLSQISPAPTTSSMGSVGVPPPPTAAPTTPTAPGDSCNNRCKLNNIVASCRGRVEWARSKVKPYTLEHAITIVNAECVGQCACVAAFFGSENVTAQPAPVPTTRPTGAPTPTTTSAATVLPTAAPEPSTTVAPTTAPTTEFPYKNQYDASNPLSILVASNRKNNYFLIIGDWGKAGGPSSCQWKVANLMKQYVSDQKKAGRNLLAILTVGDNFYWAGATQTSWKQSWLPVYGTYNQSSPLFGVPWLSVLGNHDLGDNDPYAYCPDAKPLANVGGQAYGSQQFNADRNPTRPVGTELYWLPDYNYHYEIPEADLEFIFVDTNAPYVRRMLYSAGFTSSPPKCGGSANISDFLLRVQRSGESLLRTRAKEGTAKTTVILQHYPENGASTRLMFEQALNGRATNVLGAYGHAHDQTCDGRDAGGNCNMVLTGGGGGCCMGHFGGFTAVHLTEEGGFITDVESSSVRLPRGACQV